MLGIVKLIIVLLTSSWCTEPLEILSRAWMSRRTVSASRSWRTRIGRRRCLVVRDQPGLYQGSVPAEHISSGQGTWTACCNRCTFWLFPLSKACCLSWSSVKWKLIARVSCWVFVTFVSSANFYPVQFFPSTEKYRRRCCTPNKCAPIALRPLRTILWDYFPHYFCML